MNVIKIKYKSSASHKTLSERPMLIIAKYLPACCNVIKTNGYCDVKHFISFKIPSSDIGESSITILLYIFQDKMF